MTINGIKVDTSKLLTKQEVIDALNDNGKSFRDLEDVRNQYLESFGNELVWNYPICSGIGVGEYIIVVKEGFLSLPYNSVVSDIYEIFIPDEARLLDEGSVRFLLDYWKSFSDDLTGMLTDTLSIIPTIG